MKPLHAEITKVNRCPCCQSKYSTNGVRKTNMGKSAARNAQKKSLRKEMESI
jgi:hypothetical protein